MLKLASWIRDRGTTAQQSSSLNAIEQGTQKDASCCALQRTGISKTDGQSLTHKTTWLWNLRVPWALIEHVFAKKILD